MTLFFMHVTEFFDELHVPWQFRSKDILFLFEFIYLAAY
jgi:hypothetical protein